jgi:alpha-amylase
MSTLSSVDDIVLTPRPGKTYVSIAREWREDFIYFLLVDRFHDDNLRTAVRRPGRTPGIEAPGNPGAFYGGTLRGITRNLDYIAGLGCTAIWLSPVFGTNAYYGYDVNNYLDVDPRFGTMQDLVDLVEAAHGHTRDGQPWPMRVILDVVLNHSGDNWSYQGFPSGSPDYANGQRFALGAWRRPGLPLPKELRDPSLYHREGRIKNYDTYPETQYGDIESLKDYYNDDDPTGSKLINILIKTHCYWIREADVDGFRVDAVKHMGPLACSRFCSNVREYAYSLGKRGFFLFGEVATPDDDVYNRYLGQNTSSSDPTVFFGLDSVLDFRLAEGVPQDVNDAGLREVILGHAGPQALVNRLEAQRNRALNRGELGRYLVTFVDNHDSFWQPDHGRLGAQASDEQVIGAIGYLLCALGTPCLYYGTEQGFAGHGDGDGAIREAMFDAATPGRNLLNPDCVLYREIARIAEVVRSAEPLRFGRMYLRQISGDGEHFGFPYGTDYTLAFSRLLYPSEVLVAYNVSAQPRRDHVIVDAAYHQTGERMRLLYGSLGGATGAEIRALPDGTLHVQLDLAPHAFVILR